MDHNLVFSKTPSGDEAVRQSTRVVQRSMRMVLVQVDGRLTVADLVAKLGDERMVEEALRELEEGGFIAPSSEALSAWQDGRQRLKQMRAAREASGLSEMDADSVEPSSVTDDDPESLPGKGENFSSFGKPILPAAAKHSHAQPVATPKDTAVAAPRKGGGGKLMSIVVLATLLLAVAAYFLYPYGRFKPGLEAELGRILQTPVVVESVRLRLLPSPSLVLGGIRIGKDGEGSAEEIRLPAMAAITGGAFDKVDIVGGRISADRVVQMSMPAGAASGEAASGRFRRLSVDRLTVTAGALKIADLKGDVVVGSAGRIESVALQSADRSLRLGMTLTPEGPLVSFEGLAWRVIDDFPLTFDSLQAKALLQQGRLVVQRFEANAMGGSLQGTWLVDWSRGLATAGDVSFERLEARRVTSLFLTALALDGLLTGNLRLRAAGQDWRSLWANVDGQADLSVMRGAINGADLGEAARRGPGSTVRAGSTKFDRATMRLVIDPRQIGSRDLVLGSGLFNASGSFSVSRERVVESNMTVSMHSSVSSVTIPVKVVGTLPNLQATATR